MPVTVELEEDGETILIQSELRYKDLIARIPGTNYRGNPPKWRMPVSWSGYLALYGEFRHELLVGPKLMEWVTHEKQTRIDPANYYREITNMEVGDPDLFPHQRAGVFFLSTARRALLADEPGLGKTAQAIRALASLVKNGENPFPALVVCPNTLKTNWEREFTKWWPGVNVLVIHGTAVQRRKQFDTILNPKDGEPKPHVVVINWESLRAHSRLAPYGSIAFVRCKEHGGEDESISATRCEVHPRELNQIPFQAVIADEIHRSKDPKSKQTRALWGATGDADIRFALTGTPLAQNVLDLWSILHWLDPKEWPSKSKWQTRMVDTMDNAFGGIYVLGVKAQQAAEFFASINPRMRRMLKQVVLPFLPEIVYETREVEMSAKQKKAYNQMAEKMIAEIDGNYVLAPSVLTQITRLLQFSVAYAEMVEDPDTGETNVQLSEPSGTVDAVMDDILSGDFGEDSIAISSFSRQLVDLLSARMTKAGLPHGLITGDISPDIRQKNIDDFQEGKTKYIIYTVQAGGVGVTLTRARRLLRILRPWSIVDDKQSNDRVHRIGSQDFHNKVIITDYVVPGTVQERVVEVLDSKAASFEEVVKDQEQLKRVLGGVVK